MGGNNKAGHRYIKIRLCKHCKLSVSINVTYRRTDVFINANQTLFIKRTSHNSVLRAPVRDDVRRACRVGTRRKLIKN